MAIKVFAPAKINLALHVTGRRTDGYHLLDSLVAFAPVGDDITLTDAAQMSLRVEGPEGAHVPDGADNLVMKAAARMSGTVSIALHKVLPVASGIGGGSSDAAAILRGLSALHGCPVPMGTESLGADVPMCITPHPARVQGIGEDIAPVTLPALPAVLVNPRVPVSTPQVFKALVRRDLLPMPEVPSFPDVETCISWLVQQRNDLQAAAISIAPEIGRVIAALSDLPGCRLARMSGSGATCFALFLTEAAADDAAGLLRAHHPDWWVAAGALGDQTHRAAPQFI